MTLGHSTRPWDDFLEILRRNGVGVVADVRTIPRSRHNPQFEIERMGPALREAGIGYAWLPNLGGLRNASPTSRNTAWRNASFRGFADYMQTPQFASGVEELLALARATAEHEPPNRVAILCAEAVPWRCHRSLIADSLLARGVAVAHIFTADKTSVARPTPFAQFLGEKVIYPGPDGPN